MAEDHRATLPSNDSISQSLWLTSVNISPPPFNRRAITNSHRVSKLLPAATDCLLIALSYLELHRELAPPGVNHRSTNRVHFYLRKEERERERKKKEEERQRKYFPPFLSPLRVLLCVWNQFPRDGASFIINERSENESAWKNKEKKKKKRKKKRNRTKDKRGMQNWLQSTNNPSVQPCRFVVACAGNYVAWSRGVFLTLVFHGVPPLHGSMGH